MEYQFEQNTVGNLIFVTEINTQHKATYIQSSNELTALLGDLEFRLECSESDIQSSFSSFLDDFLSQKPNRPEPKQTKKLSHGGKRTGAGRPKGEEKKVFRCTKEEIKLIKTIRSLNTNFDNDFIFEKLNEVAKKAETNPMDFHCI